MSRTFTHAEFHAETHGNEEPEMSFSLLWSKILDSSLWIQESKETRLVWITILAMKDKNGRVFSSVVGLADRAKVKPEECRKAIRVLESPDPEDSSGVDEGRRLRRIPGGWQVVNHEHYQFSDEAKREAWRIAKMAQREARAAAGRKGGRKKSRKLPGEDVAEQMRRSGATQEQIDKFQESTLP